MVKKQIGELTLRGFRSDESLLTEDLRSLLQDLWKTLAGGAHGQGKRMVHSTVTSLRGFRLTIAMDAQTVYRFYSKTTEWQILVFVMDCDVAAGV